MKIAVTGASGHLGANLVRALLADGCDVRAITAEPVHQPLPALQRLKVERVCGDVTNPRSIRRACEGADTVYHLAARISVTDRDAAAVWDVNVKGTANVVEACLQNDVRRLVHVSSYHAITPGDRQATDDDGPPSVADGLPAYARSKAFGELAVRDGIERGLDAVIVRPSGMIGPFDFKPSMLGSMLVDMWRGRLPAVVAGGVNLVDVRDVASTLIHAERRGKCGSRYLVAGSWLSIAELADVACALIGRRPPRMVTPLWIARAVAPIASAFSRLIGREPRLTDQALTALADHRLVLDGRAREELGHRPRPIEQTLVDTYEWFAECVDQISSVPRLALVAS